MPARKHTGEFTFFDQIDSASKAYWLGFLLTDGTVTKDGHEVVLDLADLDQVEKFKAALNCTYPITRLTRIKKTWSGVTYAIHVSSSYLNKQLQTLGIVPNKTYNHAPFYTPKEPLFQEFVRGVIDGDGGFCKSPNKYGKPQYQLYCYNRNMAVLELVKTFFACGKIYNNWHGEGNLTYLFNTGSEAVFLPLLDSVYANSYENTRLTRKYQKYCQLSEVTHNVRC